ncbi:hypothetical protein [Tropicibacter naphthalenivorans]|uniref:TRAP-type C4-dicarboxylate transport system, small permease component n=1 Tax=Tropicibacter naphthalenivorans TaxID=441103 RepID=A0A0P1GJV5_9RHOB|nr:hypothetical protein [Tropicibacter naphthalenivorans]CUH75027.1 hypothetical protein TRN7648_00215 [Tropicibacter naphthalenivorans]SMC47257.1 hypothetical protein SAMN04488093_101665 [Tropicibacter naphthalenivorans]
MQDLFALLSSPAFKGAMYNLAMVSLALGFGVVAVALTFYSRGRAPQAQTPQDARWILLMGTWRDSLTITLLYVAESFLYKFNDFHAIAEVMSSTPMTYPPLVTPILGFVLYVLIFTVAALRIIAITRWLREVGKPTPD